MLDVGNWKAAVQNTIDELVAVLSVVGEFTILFEIDFGAMEASRLLVTGKF